jgi:hypothetical protein
VIRRRTEDTTQDAPRVGGSQLLQVLAPRAKSVKLLLLVLVMVWPLGCKERVPGTRGGSGLSWPVGEIAPGVLLCLAWMFGQQADELAPARPFAG